MYSLDVYFKASYILFILFSLHLFFFFCLSRINNQNRICNYSSFIEIENSEDIDKPYLYGPIINDKNTFLESVNSYNSNTFFNIPVLKINNHYYFNSGILIPRSFIKKIYNVQNIETKIDLLEFDKKTLDNLKKTSDFFSKISDQCKFILNSKDVLIILFNDEFFIKTTIDSTIDNNIIDFIKMIDQNNIFVNNENNKQNKLYKKNTNCYDITLFNEKKIIFKTLISMEDL